MGQCEVCTQQLQYNAIDSDDLLKELTTLELGQDILRLRSQNQDYLSQFKFTTTPDKAYYRGKLNNAQREGYAEMYCDQFNYFGFFKDDLPHGIGALITQDKCLYGQFVAGLLQGEGQEWEKGYRFEGTYQAGERKEGTLYRDQMTYSGQFRRNLYHGNGKLTMKEGATYDGEFVDGKFEGKGRLQFANGNSYQGGLKEGKYHGYGEFSWANGNSYKGEYVMGKKEGYGVLTLQKVEYAGRWKNDIREGHGILRESDQQVFGQWRNNHLIEG